MIVYVVSPVWGGVGSEPCVFTDRLAAELCAIFLAQENNFNPDDEVKVFECVVDDQEEQRCYNPPCVWDAEYDYTTPDART